VRLYSLALWHLLSCCADEVTILTGYAESYEHSRPLGLDVLYGLGRSSTGVTCHQLYRRTG
jgi:hypothetical protein